MFAASVPRGKDGRVRVIPILRRGFSLISPAPVSKVTIAAFNQIRAEEHAGEKADWSAVSQCYAALSSARWNEPQSEVSLAEIAPDTIQLGEKGLLSVSLELDSPAPGRWMVTYGRDGQLEKTEYTPFGSQVWQPLPATVMELKGTPIPPNVTEMKGNPLPSTQGVQGRPLPTGPEPTGKPIPPTTPNDSQSKPQ
jgi:hypothetical protein